MTDSFKQVENEILRERIAQLEEAVMSLSADIQNLSSSMKDMQRFIVKMATNQSQLAERVSMWPYVKLENKPKPPRKPRGD
jgi:hypothetical protein